MHFKNGREAKVGDLIVHRRYHSSATGINSADSYGTHAVVSRIVSITPAVQSCNAVVVPANEGESVNLGECLHVDDIPNPLEDKPKVS